MKGLLVLENGARFEGDLLGSVEGLGELVFNTGMTGYQECFTDPSYEGQILTLTYPLIGNYGANDLFMQNRKPAAAGYVLDQIAEHPSNWECKEKITDFIERYHVPCLYNVDTRAVTRMVRTQSWQSPSTGTRWNGSPRLTPIPTETASTRYPSWTAA